MRATDDRYRGEQAKFDLAMRMIGHEARTGTIRYLTGLNDDRIRKLYTSYFKYGEEPVRRQRGRSPTRIGPLVRTPQRALESGVFANLLLANGLISVEQPPGPPLKHNVDLGHRFCECFETFDVLGAAQLVLVRVVLESARQHAPRRRARHRALRCVLDLLRVRRACRCRARRARRACCSSSAARSSRSPRPGSMAACASSSSRVGATPRYPLVVAANRDEQHARPAASAALVARAAARARRARSASRRHVARHRSPRPVRGRHEHSRPAAAGSGCARAARSSRTISPAPIRPSDYAARAVRDGARASAHSICSSTTAASSGSRAIARRRRARRQACTRSATRRPASSGRRPRARAPAPSGLLAQLRLAASSRCSRCSPSATTRSRRSSATSARISSSAPTYGTRCSTVVLVDATGRATFAERSFDAAGSSSARCARASSSSAR